MNPNFAATIAPELQLLGPDDPAPGGLQEDQGFTADGTPRPYMTNPDGSRQYFGAAVTGIPNVAPQGPAPTRGPIQGIRLRDQAIPYMSNPDDPSGVREYWAGQGRFVLDDPSASVAIPQGPQNAVPPEPRIGQDQIAPRRLPNGGAGLRLAEEDGFRPPPFDVPMVNNIRPLDNGQPSDLMTRQQPNSRNYGTRGVVPIPREPQAGSTHRDPILPDAPNTVGALLERLGITLPQPGPRAAAAGADLRGRGDPNAQLSALPEVPRMERPGPMGHFAELSTPEGLADLNTRLSRGAAALNINYTPIGDQMRTRAEQRDLQNRGATDVDFSWHNPTGDGHVYAFDLPPRAIGNLSGDNNRWRVRQLLQAAGLPWREEDVDVVWEDGRSRGTGAHYHIEPTPQYNQYRYRIPPQE